MTHDNRTHNRIARLVHQAAEQAAPGDLDLWPGIEAQIVPRPVTAAHHRRGTLTLVAALLIVIAAALAFSLLHNSDGNPLHVASLNQNATPTVSPDVTHAGTPEPDEPTAEAPAADPYALCRRYPQFCMPYVGGAERSDLMARIENPNNLFRPVEVRSSGVVRGLTPDGLPFIGNPAAPAHVEVVTDFGCPHCWPFHEGDLLHFVEDYVLAGQATVRLRLIDSIDPDFSPGAAQAALCAGEQNALWEMTSQLMTIRSRMSESRVSPDTARDTIRLAASELDLDADALLACVSSQRYSRVIDHYRQEVEERGVIGVPTVRFRDSASGEWTQIAATYESMASFTELANDYPGQQMLDTVSIQPSAFESSASYVHSSTLTRNDPREDYHLEGGGQLFEALDASDGWVLFSVSGEAFTPYLYADQTITTTNHNYRTGDGALLVNWMHDVPGADQDLFHQVSYNIIVDGNITTLPGDYTFSVQPVTDVRSLAGEPAPVTLAPRVPVVATYHAPEGALVTLDVRVGHRDDATGAEPYPDVAVLLPNGRTLTTFNPGETYVLHLSFVAPPADEQYLVFNPLDVDATESRDSIALMVSVASGRLLADMPTLEELELPEGTVAVTVPLAGMLASDRSEAAMVGQDVDVLTTFSYIDIGDGFQSLMPGDAELIVTAPGNIVITTPLDDAGAPVDVQLISQRVIRGARVLGVGSHFMPFDQSESLVWITDDSRTLITLAVSRQDALVLTWAIDAGISIQIVPAAD